MLSLWYIIGKDYVAHVYIRWKMNWLYSDIINKAYDNTIIVAKKLQWKH